jgi:hypothetical protein
MSCFECGKDLEGEGLQDHYELEVRKVAYMKGPAPYTHIMLQETKLILGKEKFCKDCVMAVINRKLLIKVREGFQA